MLTFNIVNMHSEEVVAAASNCIYNYKKAEKQG